MTKLLEKALAIVRGLPPIEQDEIAQAMLSLADAEAGVEAIDPAHLTDVFESLAQAWRREIRDRRRGRSRVPPLREMKLRFTRRAT